MPLNEQVVDSVTAANFKNVAEAPGFYSGLAMGDAVAHQRGMNVLREAILGRLSKSIVEEDVSEAVAVSKIGTGNDLAQQLQALLTALNSGMQGVKSAQSTPPETGKVS